MPPLTHCVPRDLRLTLCVPPAGVMGATTGAAEASEARPHRTITEDLWWQLEAPMDGPRLEEHVVFGGWRFSASVMSSEMISFLSTNKILIVLLSTQ